MRLADSQATGRQHLVSLRHMDMDRAAWVASARRSCVRCAVLMTSTAALYAVERVPNSARPASEFASAPKITLSESIPET